MKKIGLLGSAVVGQTLAQGFKQHGYEVRIGSRSPAKLASFTESSGIPAGTFDAVGEWGELLVLAVHGTVAVEALTLAGAANHRGKVVIDATNPPKATPAGMSGLETLMSWAPEAHWVKAFNTLPTSVLTRRRGHDPLLAEFVCTDLVDARLTASKLIRDLGFAPVFAGRADTARYVETGGPLQMNEIDVQDATDVLAGVLGDYI